MIIKRIAGRARAQNWFSVRLDFFIAATGIVVCGLLGAVSAAANDSVCKDGGDAAHVAAVKDQRDVFNRAIRHLDIDAIGAVLSDDVILITGTDSDVYTGREAQLGIWRGDRENADRAIYARTPACVQVSPTFPVAMEYGTWHGAPPLEPANFAAGSYTAKWRLTEGTWLLEIETYMTERCGGSFCPKPEEKP